ncbi:hypothetical protein O181_045251 [Austropuccinia psidii MF-1]|uniref:Uncharacterized protein n=1 Tax=Austropuccinia psidii MF-1 TaxID=1389203 RepID=A0A9Q3DRZ3_9BASI|nr:hypothetical protein [Austropuccinia psidii MF-1]
MTELVFGTSTSHASMHTIKTVVTPKAQGLRLLHSSDSSQSCFGNCFRNRTLTNPISCIIGDPTFLRTLVTIKSTSRIETDQDMQLLDFVLSKTPNKI